MTPQTRVLTGSDIAGQIDKIEQMMRDPGTLGEPRLGGANLDLAVHGDGIAIHDFASEALGQGEREGRLSAPGGTHHGYQEGLTFFRRQAQRALQLMLCQ